jgi:hypothetical protein
MYNPVSMPDPLSLAIALVALGVAGASLYKTHLEKASIQVYPATTIGVVSNPDGKVSSVQVPCTFVNTGARPGTVQHLELTASRQPFRWDRFYRYSPGLMEVQRDSEPYPFTIPGRNSVFRAVQFTTPAGLQVRWNQGEFELRIHGWVNQGRLAEDSKLKSDAFHVKIGPDLEAQLAGQGRFQVTTLNIDEWIRR